MADFTLSSTSGAYTIVGAASILALTLGVASGSYTLTGSDAGTVWGHPITANVGSYVVTGQPIQTRRITAEPVGYILNGTAVNLLYNTRKVVALGGSYAITSETSFLRVAKSYDLGAYAVTGVAATLTSTGDPVIGATSGAYTITGSAAGLVSTLGIDSGDYQVTGTAVTFRKGKGLQGNTRAFQITGVSATLKHPKRMPASPAAYSILNSAQVILQYSGNIAKFIAVDGGQFVITTFPAALSVKLNAASGAYSITGKALHSILGVQSGAYTLTGLPTSSLLVSNGQYILTGQPAGLLRTVAFVRADSGVYTIAGLPKNIRALRILPGRASTGFYTTTGTDAFLRITRITASAGYYSYAGGPANLITTRSRRWRKQPRRSAQTVRQPQHTTEWSLQDPEPGIQSTV